MLAPKRGRKLKFFEFLHIAHPVAMLRDKKWEIDHKYGGIQKLRNVQRERGIPFCYTPK